MIAAPVRADEQQRLAALASYDIMDSGAEAAFDEIVRAASLALGCEIGLVSLVDDQRQWFKAKIGIDAEETAREYSFCAHAVFDRSPLIVPDATRDERFRDNPLVTGDPDIRFYAGAPLIGEDGHALGSLCVIDSSPRDEFDDTELEILQILSRQVMRLIEARRVGRELVEALQQVKELAPMIPVCAWCTRVRDDNDYWSSVQEYLAEHAGTLTSHSICPECLEKAEAELDGLG